MSRSGYPLVYLGKVSQEGWMLFRYIYSREKHQNHNGWITENYLRDILKFPDFWLGGKDDGHGRHQDSSGETRYPPAARGLPVNATHKDFGG